MSHGPDADGKIEVGMITRAGARVRTMGGSVVTLDRPKPNGMIRCWHDDGREDEISRTARVKVVEY